MNAPKPLTVEERIAIARAPITVGILSTNYNIHCGHPYAGCGERPTTPVFNEWGRVVGSRAIRTSDGCGND